MIKKFLKTKGFARSIALIITLCMVTCVFAACGGGNSEPSITLDKTSVTLYEGDSETLKATTKEADADVEWSSSNTGVVTVRKGVLETVAAGTAVITASLESGESATCAVTVNVRTITISKTEATIDLGSADKTLTLTAEANDGGTVSWASSNPSVASVSSGLVTALDVGETTITAQKGRAKATCVVTVTDDSRPADYYFLAMNNNADSRANPGKWHYWADGTSGTAYKFSEAPLHANSSLSVTLSIIPNLTDQFFYFRYQPKYTTSKAFTIKFDVEFSLAGIVRYGTNANYGGFFNQTLTKNESSHFEYSGTINDLEPFSIRPNVVTNPNNEPLNIKVTNIVVETDWDGSGGEEPGEDEPEVPVDIVMGNELLMKTNSETVASPGNWYYMADGAAGTNFEFSVAPNYNSALNIVSMGLKYSTSGAVYQLRYQPTFAAGENYTVTFDVQLTAAGSIVYSPGNKVESFTKAGKVSLSWSGAVGTSPFYIQLRPSKPDKSIKIIVSNIVFTPESSVPVDNLVYNLDKKTNGETVASPGTWYYMADGTAGTDYEFSVAPNYNKGTLTMGFNRHASGTPAYQLRYQPNFAAGTTYTVTFDVLVSAAGKVIYSPANLAKDFTAGETASISWTGAVSATAPFFIQIRATDSTAPIMITITNIVFTPAT